MFNYHQSAINEAALAGKAWLQAEDRGPNNTPIKDRILIESVRDPVQNQYSVTFKIGGVLTDVTGKAKPYGFAQENGWHDRGGNFHEGHHMLATAAEKAMEAYIAFMGGPEGGSARLGQNRGFFKGDTDVPGMHVYF
jgi:hypothetical protein